MNGKLFIYYNHTRTTGCCPVIHFVTGFFYNASNYFFYTEQYIHATTHARIPHFFMLYTQVPIVNVMGGLLILFALAVKVYVPAGIEPVSTSDPRLP